MIRRNIVKRRLAALTVPAALSASLAFVGFNEALAVGYSYSTPGSPYEQDFNTLPRPSGWGGPNNNLGDSPTGWIDDSPTHDPPVNPSVTSGPLPADYNFSLTGWYLWHPAGITEGGANGHQRFRNGSGGSGTGSFYSFGASNGNTERALGIVNSATLANVSAYAYIGLRLVNDTGVTLTEFTLQYNGEQWRADNANAQKLEFGWKVRATTVQESDFNAVSALDFTSPVLGTGNGLGNGDGKAAIGPATVTGINWGPGEHLWLRWADMNDDGLDHGLAIDDVVFSASAAVGGSADFDDDNDVDGADFLIWQRGVSIDDGSALPVNGDATGEGNVDGDDLAVWKSQFGQPSSLANIQAVPEPSAALLAAAGLAGLTWRRRLR